MKSFILFQKQSTLRATMRRFLAFALLFIAHYSLFIDKAHAQCSTTPSVMVRWDFNSTTVQCNGANGKGSTTPLLLGTSLSYCPNFNSGCAEALLGTMAHQNTTNFSSALCLYGFYVDYVAARIGYDQGSTVWNPKHPAMISITYKLPKGKVGCLNSFALAILQKQFNGTTTYFEKQGVSVYRNNVMIYDQTRSILASNINAGLMSFAFPNTPEYCSDGSKDVTFTIYFGLIHQLHAGPIGYDDIIIKGTCGDSPSPTAAITPVTCNATGANTDGKIKLSNFGATDKYQYSLGATFNAGTATPATATVIPVGGLIASTLPNPAIPQDYTVRITTKAGCTTDLKVTLYPSNCPSPPTGCTKPTATVTPTAATCVGNDGSIAVSGVTNGDKVAISTGTSFSGPLYAAATPLISGAYTFTGLSNPVGSQDYVIRVYNGADDCVKDYPITLTETACPCTKVGIQVCASSAADPDSSPNNSITTEDDFATYEVCKGTQNIDLKLTKSVTPTTGTTCPTNTNFVWTVTITNAGTMTATGIQVADIMPTGLVETAFSVTTGTYNNNSGWIIPSLAAGASATLSITTKATVAGTFTNCAEIMTAFPLNDPNSTPGNGITTEDDYACATITVTGNKTPEIVKEFSPWSTKPNVPIRLTIKIVNNESTPINMTAALVDALPNSPAQMTIATTPNLTTGLAGVIATAGGTSITIPSGTVLMPGLNTIQLDVIAPSDGQYCNTIAAGALKTTSCDNLVDTQTCVDVKTTYVLAPLISKSMNPSVVNVGANSTLTITIANRNTQTITLLQDFIDYLPTSLVIAGAASGTCPNVSTFASTSQVGLTAGAVLSGNSTCTIVVPVTSSTAGTYCNYIPANSMIGNVNVVGGDVMTGNEDHAEACVTVNATPCTAVGTVSIMPSPIPTTNTGATVNLTASATGTGASTVYTWANSGTGTFSSQVASPTYTAPATAGTYTLSVTVNNNLTGYGTCTASATATISVAVPVGPCTAVTGSSIGLSPVSPVVAGTTVTLTASKTDAGTPTTYTWAASPSTGFTSTTQTATLTNPTAGTYNFTVTIQNNNGTGTCTATATTSLTVTLACTPPSGILAGISQVTCTNGVANANGKITLSGFSTEKYDLFTGDPYAGTATFATATTIPAGGIIVSNLANPAVSQAYTIRVFNGNNCYTDVKVTLNNKNCTCPVICEPVITRKTKG